MSSITTFSLMGLLPPYINLSSDAVFTSYPLDYIAESNLKSQSKSVLFFDHSYQIMRGGFKMTLTLILGPTAVVFFPKLFLKYTLLLVEPGEFRLFLMSYPEGD